MTDVSLLTLPRGGTNARVIYNAFDLTEGIEVKDVLNEDLTASDALFA